MVPKRRVDWLRLRLRTMRPTEILSRLADISRHAVLYSSLNGVVQRAQREPDGAAPLLKASQFNQLGMVPQEVQHRVVAGAGRWLNHRAAFFALRDTDLGDPINWHCDYSSGVIAPMRYSGVINHRDVDAVGDVKYIWELNRLQHLLWLALAWFWTENSAYWKEIGKQVLSWNKTNPFMMGVNWKSPLEAAIRLIAWAYVSMLTEHVGEEREAYQKILRAGVYQHQYFIKQFYSKNSSANNHLIGEMTGLYVGSVFWPGYPESASWRSFARQTLIQEIDRQVEADGVSRERATEYQMFVLECFLLAGALGQAIGDPFPQEYWQRITRMAAFLLTISNRAGDFPMFGDGDSGQVISLPETTAERFRALVRLGQSHDSAVTPDLRSVLLLWGQPPKDIPMGPVRSSRRNVEAFSKGGYYVLATDRGGDNEIVIVFDVGPLGLPPLYAHGHADALSFWLSYGGQEFLIDPGTYCYHGSTLWRSYFRGTGAHNTIRADGEDQSVSGGPFLWSQAAQCRIENINETDEFVEVAGSHDGYRRLPDPVTHIRALRLFKQSRSLTITDRLDCRGAHDIELLFHFGEQCRVRQAGPQLFELSNHNKCLALRVDSRLKPQLYHGCENPIFGWVSRSFGVKEPSFTLVGRATITGASQFLTEISAT